MKRLIFIPFKSLIFLHLLSITIFFFIGCKHYSNINPSFPDVPKSIEKISAKDGSVWERVNLPGFGDETNIAVVAMQGYQGHLYAMVRNDAKGVEMWRTSGKKWEQVLFPEGIRNGIYENPMINTHMGAMVVFKGKLYCGFSSGIQGNYLKSSGCEIWCYDGNSWEPVVSDKKDKEEWGTITGISGCKEKDEETAAFITDETKNWKDNQWTGGILQITSGKGKFRRFDIISNTSKTLTVQQNEIAGETGTEYTVCETKHYINPFPFHEYDLPKISAGDSYEIGTGSDENGFGDYFNKAISSMVIFDSKIYVSMVLNYDYGGQVWYTEDGDNWNITTPTHSLGLFHTDRQYPGSKKPVTRGIPSLCACDVSGAETLYAGTLGSDGNLGGCARMAKLTPSGWELIIDTNVDENDTGTNENGFGGGMNCSMFNGNFNLWSQACFKGKLFVGMQSLAGSRVLFTPNGSSEDGNWFYSVGGDAVMPAGFDGAINKGATAVMKTPISQTISVNLFPFKDNLYAGLIRLYMPLAGAGEDSITGSQIWRTEDGAKWIQVTDNGLGDKKVLSFEAFAVFNDALYVSGSGASNTVGGGLQGVKIFRLVTTNRE